MVGNGADCKEVLVYCYTVKVYNAYYCKWFTVYCGSDLTVARRIKNLYVGKLVSLTANSS